MREEYYILQVILCFKRDHTVFQLEIRKVCNCYGFWLFMTIHWTINLYLDSDVNPDEYFFLIGRFWSTNMKIILKSSMTQTVERE